MVNEMGPTHVMEVRRNWIHPSGKYGVGTFLPDNTPSEVTVEWTEEREYYFEHPDDCDKLKYEQLCWLDEFFSSSGYGILDDAELDAGKYAVRMVAEAASGPDYDNYDEYPVWEKINE
jgi:hypothetical protein